MLNRNFANAVASTFNSMSTYKTTITNSRVSNSYNLKSFFNNNLNTQKLDNLSSGYYTFGFGTDDTPATFEDYCLLNRVDDNASFSILSPNVTTDGNNTIISQVWSYSGSAEITINEIGLFGNNGGKVMFDRTVLESPITVDSEHNTFTIALTIGGKATVTPNS